MAIVGNKTNSRVGVCFFLSFWSGVAGVVFVVAVVVIATQLCGLIPVDDRSRFTMRTQTVLIVMKYTNKSMSFSFSPAAHIRFLLSVSTTTTTTNSLFSRRLPFYFVFLSFQCVCVISFIGPVSYWFSHRPFAQISSLSSYAVSVSHFLSLF